MEQAVEEDPFNVGRWNDLAISSATKHIENRMNGVRTG